MRRLTDIAATALEPAEGAGCGVCSKRAGKECGRVQCAQRKPETALPPGPAHMLPVNGRTTPRRRSAE